MKIWFGSKPTDLWKPLFKKFQDRLRFYGSFEFAHLKAPAFKPKGRLTLEQVREVLQKEVEKGLDRTDYLVLLDEEGKKMTSDHFAGALKKWKSHKSVVFLIGGPDGFNQTLRARASERISLSSLSLTHECASIILLEQFYRSFKNNLGESYDR